MTAPDIFLSYNRQDQAVAKRYADALAAHGFAVWWDQALRSGEAYDEVTEAALRGARAVVVLWSPRSVASRWVRAEATIADRCKTFIPVTIEACERPVMFELTQTADLSHWRGDRQDPAWLAFVSDVGRMVGRERVLAAAPPPPPSAPVASTGNDFIPIMAVLPVSTRRGDTDEDAIFAADLTDELLAALSACSMFRILPGRMSPAWQDKLVDLRPVARDLGAFYLLDPTLRRTGDGFRVTIRLIEGETGKLLWSQKFDRPLAELDLPPDELAQAAAVQAEDKATWLCLEQASAKTNGLTAWDHLLRAIAGAIDSTLPGRMAAEMHCDEALRLAPEWGYAHAVRAAVWALSRLYAGDPDGSKQAAARHHVNMAIRFDKATPAVLMYAGCACNWLGDPAPGLPMLERALALHPSLTGIHFHLQTAYLLLGRLAESIAAGDRHMAGTTADPLNRWVCLYQSIAHFLAGDFAAAQVAGERGLYFNPRGDYLLVWRAVLLATSDETQRARGEVARLRTLEPDLTLEGALSMVGWTMMADAAKAAATQATFQRLWEEVPGRA